MNALTRMNARNRIDGRSIRLMLCLALLMMGFATAQAQSNLQQGKSGAVSWVAGGISAGQIDALAAREKEHTLKLVFTLNAGNYLAGVDVVVRDAKGTAVLEQSNTGPVLLAQLPRGSYTVSATSEGRTQTRKVQVGDRLRTEYMRWAASKDDFVLPPARR